MHLANAVSFLFACPFRSYQVLIFYYSSIKICRSTKICYFSFKFYSEFSHHNNHIQYRKRPQPFTIFFNNMFKYKFCIHPNKINYYHTTSLKRVYREQNWGKKDSKTLFLLLIFPLTQIYIIKILKKLLT